MKKSIALTRGLILTLAFVFIVSYAAMASATKAKTAPKPVTKAPAPKTVKVYQGMGQNSTFRVGPGMDKNNVQIYTFTIVTANALFDQKGKIINVYFDSLEVSTPNYEGESMPHFSGWPGTQGYNVADHKTGEITGASQNTNDTITAEVNNWQSKRERGDKYGMNPKNDWYKQADFYQNFFKGKTVAEIEKWFAKYCSDVNGKPLTPTSSKDGDKEKYAKLSAAEKTSLADVVSGATMSLKDVHGDFIGALKEAYAKRVSLTVPVQ